MDAIIAELTETVLAVIDRTMLHIYTLIVTALFGNTDLGSISVINFCLTLITILYRPPMEQSESAYLILLLLWCYHYSALLVSVL